MKKTGPSFVGVVCGLKSEAAAVRAALRGDERVRIGVSGANAARAEKIANDFCEDGARAILSIGVSGGLDPDLKPGVLIIGERVIAESSEAFECDGRLLAALDARPPGFVSGLLFGADAVIVSAEEKRTLKKRHACLAVDMESHGAARAAAAAGVPFAAIRAIADPADRVLPPAALGAVAPDGSTRVLKTLLAALSDPRQLPMLMKLGGDSSAALNTLRRDLGPLFHAVFEALEM